MPNCLQHFSNPGLCGKSLSAILQAENPEFACELETCSVHSPSVVIPAEMVAFLLINPHHFDRETGTVLPIAFEQLTKSDLSVLRLDIATRAQAECVRQQLIARGAMHDASEPRKVDQACVGTVADIRAAQLAGQRLMGVFDTALEDVVAHASVMCCHAAYSDKQLRRVTRERLHSIMAPNIHDFDDLFGHHEVEGAAPA